MGGEQDTEDFEGALAECGVRAESLSAAEKSAIDEQGYVLLLGIADERWLKDMRAALDTLAPEIDAQAAGKESGTRHIADLAWIDPVFDEVYVHPRMLAAAHHALERAFGVLLLSSRDPSPGFGQQALHQDWLPRAPSTPFEVLTAIWFLDDFTRTNGATRVVPRSHVLPGPLPASLRSPKNRHPDEELIVGPAGSVLIFNGHLWHSGTRNTSNTTRRALQCQYVARDRLRPADPMDERPELPERLAPGARFFLRR